MTRTEMIDTIRAGRPLNHKTLQAIADELESLGNHLQSCMLTNQEQEQQLREMGRAFADARQRVVRMGVNEQELLARCDALELEVVTLQETLAGAANVMRQAMTMMAIAPQQ